MNRRQTIPAGRAPDFIYSAHSPAIRAAVSDVYNSVMEIVGSDKIREASRKVFDAILGGSVKEPEKPAYVYKPMRM